MACVWQTMVNGEGGEETTAIIKLKKKITKRESNKIREDERE